MIRQLQKLVLFLALAGYAITGNAAKEKVKIGALTYFINNYSSGSYAEVCAPEEGDYSGDIVIPEEVTYEGVTYPVTGIFAYAFCNDPSVTSVSIPNTIEKIGINAFLGCRSLKSLTIPESVTSFEADPFGACTLNPLIIKTKNVKDYSKVFTRINGSSKVYAYSSEISKIRSYYHKVYDLEAPCEIDVIDTYIKGVKFKLNPNPFQEGTYKVQSVRVDDKTVEPDADGIYFVKGLRSFNNEASSLTIAVYCSDEDNSSKTVTGYATLKPTVISLTAGRPTHTTMTFYVSANTDETAIPVTAQVRVKDPSGGYLYSSSDMQDGKATVKFDNLIPGRKYSYGTYNLPEVYVAYEDETGVYGSGTSGFTTKTITVAYTDEEITPTSYRGSFEIERGDYNLSDITLNIRQGETTSSVDFTGKDKEIILSGLDPDSFVSFYILGTETTKTIKTSVLELTTLQPRGVSNTCSIVAAETNISEDETNVGFQWKKYDAPESLKPSEGYAAIYNGRLEGYIRNLQPTSYYNVRAFYKSAAGNYYYSDWVTFDPSDFSYFEPTVHTYAATDVTHSSVRVKGYVLAGTEPIDEQGFEYWPTDAERVNALRVKAEATAEANDVQTVLATGQVMTAELRDLKSETTYCCRAFVKTATGTTYGEEQTFTTEADPTGADGIVAEEAAAPAVIGYYDMFGRKSATPHHGVNIVRYSNGTTRKVLMK